MAQCGRKDTAFVAMSVPVIIFTCLLWCNLSTCAPQPRTSPVLLPTYEEVAGLGTACHPNDTCDNEPMAHLTDFRNCACDEACATYGDCCLDSKFIHKMSKSIHREWSCVSFATSESTTVYMKASCPSSWKDETIRRKCVEADVVTGGTKNPLQSLPVTNPNTDVTYKNLYCATCHNDANDLVIWEMQLICEYVKEYNVTMKNVTDDFVLKNLEYDDVEESWGVWMYDGMSGNKHFYACEVKPSIPSGIGTRKCLPQRYDACPEDWKNEEDADKCESYMSYRSVENESFRNIHCAICNGINLSAAPVSCAKVDEKAHHRFQGRPFSLLLDINDKNGGIVGEKNRCLGGEFYDPYFKRCTSIVCETPGLYYDSAESKCKKRPVVSVRIYADVDAIPGSGGFLPNPRSSIDQLRNISEGSGDILTSDDEGENATKSYASFKWCPKTRVAFEEYVIVDNETIYVPKYNQHYNSSWYRINDDESLTVCVHFLNNTDMRVARFSAYLGYITVIGLGISIFCLFLHLIVFILVPDLRNLSGRNLTSLVVALLFAYFLFILGQLSLSSTACRIVAIVTYYFFLASFFWMNTMAFDVWRTLRMATKELRVSNGRQWQRFSIYFIYAWLTSAMIVISSVVVDHTSTVSEDLRPGFGKYQCWFGQRKALLVFFVTPAAVIMAANVFLFISSARMIIVTTKTSVGHQSSSTRNNYKLYLRLSVIMGLTWVTGFIAGYTDVEVLWCIFVVLNTLQGLFIFVAFSCTQKVCNSLRDRIRRMGKSPAFRSSSVNSATASAYSNSTVHTRLSRTVTPQNSTASDKWKFSFRR